MIQAISIRYTAYLNHIKNNSDYYKNYLETSTLINTIITFVVIMSLVTPILEFYSFNNKRNLDTLFALPISKSKMILAHYLNGAVQIFVAFTVMYLIWLFSYVFASYTELHVGYSYLAYPVILLSALGIYTIFSFIFIRANTTADGFAFIFLHAFLFVIMGEVVRYFWNDQHFVIVRPQQVTLFEKIVLEGEGYVNFFEQLREFIPSFNLISVSQQISRILNIVIAPTTDLTKIGIDGYYTIYSYNYTYRNIEIEPYHFWLFGISAVLVIASFVLMITGFKVKNTSFVGEISSSWFGYKTLLPMYSIGWMLLYHDDYALSTIGLVLMFLGYVLYRRGVRFKIPDFVVMAVATVIAVFGKGLGL
ncbi:MAG: hypothetical protein E7312_06925 [Clostridiales bacterium]|nr:hypothetical protein [Clostridiales bacterium]